MKYLALLLFTGMCFAQGGTAPPLEIRRPTSDADGGTNAGLGCVGTDIASAAMKNAYDGSGLTTSSNQVTSGSDTAIQQASRVFSTWQTTGNTYTALTLNMNASSLGYLAQGGLGNACLNYSTNGGSSWTKIICDKDGSGAGFPSQTFTVTLSATQNLSLLRVGICTQGSKGISRNGVDPGTDNLSIADIWTSGTEGAPTGGGSPPAGTNGNPHRGGAVIIQ